MVRAEHMERPDRRDDRHHRRILNEAAIDQHAGLAEQQAIARRAADHHRIAQGFLHGHAEQLFAMR